MLWQILLFVACLLGVTVIIMRNYIIIGFKFLYAKYVNTAEISGDVIHITYWYRGKKYMAHIPYSNTQRARSLNHRVHLIYRDGSWLDITQQPGVVYTCTSENFTGGKEIHIINTSDDTKTVVEESRNVKLASFSKSE